MPSFGADKEAEGQEPPHWGSEGTTPDLRDEMHSNPLGRGDTEQKSVGTIWEDVAG